MSDSEDEPEYEVERILAERVIDGTKSFLVKWKDYPDEECTWEPRTSFNFEETIVAWQQAVARDDVLDKDLLAELEARMNAFQKGHPASNVQGSNPEGANVTAVPHTSTNTVSGIARGLRAPSEGSQTNKTPALSDSPVALPALASAVSAQISMTNSTSPAEQTVTATRALSPTKRTAITRPDDINMVSVRAGQKFRSLSHMNNYRKKARDAALIPPPRQNLINVDQLPSVNDTDTAHILPAAPIQSRNDDGSWMFFPDAMDLDDQAPPPESNIKQDNLPTTRRADAGISGTAITSETSDDRSGSKLSPEISATRREIPFEARPASTTAGSRPGPLKTQTHRADVNNEVVKPTAQLIRARNGREWYKHDVVISLTSGAAIGDVKFVSMPWVPYGRALVDMKSGTKLDIDFEPDNVIKRHVFDSLTSDPIHRRVIGLVEPFWDTERAVSQFCQHLEKYDSAGIWAHPGNVDMSMLLYSCEAPSWSDIGKRPAREGQPKSRLHFAVFPRVFIPTLHPSEVRDKVNIDLADNVSISTIGTRDPLRQTARSSDDTSPDLRGQSTESKQMSSHIQPATIEPSRDPRRRRLSVQAPTQDDTYERLMRKYASSSMVPELTLDFQVLLKSQRNGLKIEPNDVDFYVVSTESHPHETALLARWLQAHTSPRNIYSDADAEAWSRLRRHASTRKIIILFHSEDPQYIHMEGLGKMLNSDSVQCFSLTHTSPDHNSVISVTSTQFFPRGSTFLITEEEIVSSPAQAVFIGKFFVKNKKPGWIMVFRPGIRLWLKRSAACETDADRQYMLYSLLILVDELISQQSQSEEHLGDPNEMSYHEVAKGGPSSCIVSPASIPGYDDSSDDMSTIRRRDKFLIDYFCGFAAMSASKCRRFWIFSKEKSFPNSGHVYFEDPDKFVKTHSHGGSHSGTRK